MSSVLNVAVMAEGPQAAEVRVDGDGRKRDDQHDRCVDVEDHTHHQHHAEQVDEDLGEQPEQHRDEHDGGGRVVLEAFADELHDRVASRHLAPQPDRERHHHHDGEAVGYDEPDQTGRAEREGLRRRHHYRHRPGPHRDDGAHAEAEPDATVGDHEVMGVLDHSADDGGDTEHEDAQSEHERIADAGRQVGRMEHEASWTKRAIHSGSAPVRRARDVAARWARSGWPDTDTYGSAEITVM
jgi:hypothetical protein